MKKKLLTITIFCFFSIFSNNAHSATYQEFIKDLKTIFLSTNGKANLFGYTQDFGFAEVTEGSFAVGNFVVIKGKPDMATSVPPELYEDVAYGEVESIKGKYIKIFIIKRLKAIPKESVVMGLSKIYIHLNTNDDILPILNNLLREKDFVVLDKPDQKALIKMTISKLKDNSFGYKVTLTPGERIISIGNITIDSSSSTPVIVKSTEPEMQKTYIPKETVKIKPVTSTNTFITKNSKTGKIWVAEGLQIFCADCDNKVSTQYTLSEKPIYMFEENGITYVWDEKAKTTILDGTTVRKNIGYKIPGFSGYFDPLTKKIFTDSMKTIQMPENTQFVYYYKDGLALIGIEKGFSIIKDGIVQKTMNPESEVFKIKQGSLLILIEEQEEVPLAGTYYKLMIKTYSLEDLKETGALEITENIKAFDFDLNSKELIYLKKDGNIKKINL